MEVYSVTAQYFQILYNYLYSGQLKIKHDDLKGVLESAWMLEMTGLPHSFWTFSICFLCFLSSETNPSSAIPLLLLEFLDESFDVTGALHMYDFLSGRENIQESLLGNIHLLLVKHFGRIINSLDFLRLPATKVLKILGDDAISVPRYYFSLFLMCTRPYF